MEKVNLMHMISKKIILSILMVSALAGCKSTFSNNGAERRDAGNQQTAFDEASDMPTPRPKSEVAKINAQLGLAYLEQKNVQRAKLKLLLAMKQSPESPEPWYSMAYFLEATGNKSEARRHYLKAVQLAPLRGDVHNNYGTFLCHEGQYQESIKHFVIAANIPDYLDPAAAFENAGLCALKMSAYQQASGYFKQALARDPARTFSLLKLATVEAKLGHQEKARELLSQYLLISPATTETMELTQQLNKSAVKKVG
jgi:type IV pilus assembly protein PilF